MENFSLKCLTPLKSVLHLENVSSVTLPSTTGELEILPGYENFVFNLIFGVVTVKKNNLIIKIFISSGVAKINNVSCDILVDYAYNLDNIDILDVRKKLQDLRTYNDNQLFLNQSINLNIKHLNLNVIFLEKLLKFLGG